MSGALQAKVQGVRRTLLLRRGRRSPWALRVGLIIVAMYILVGVLAPLLAPYDPLVQNITNALAKPNPDHLLGTDRLGRDVLSRLIHGARVDLVLAVSATSLALAIGTILGLLAGFFRGWVDLVLSRFTDMMMAIPSYPLLVLLLFVLGQSSGGIIIAFALSGWVSYARLTRGQTLVVREQDYILAAKLGALGNARIIAKHVLPNVRTQVIVLWASDIVLAISAIAALGYLGIGIQAPTPEWGVMIADGQAFLLSNPLLAIAPGLVIVVLGIGLALISDSLATQGTHR